jgi:hypothetical protein
MMHGGLSLLVNNANSSQLNAAAATPTRHTAASGHPGKDVLQ